MNDEQLQRLITILTSEIESHKEDSESKYRSKEQQLVTRGRHLEAKFILSQVKEIVNHP